MKILVIGEKKHGKDTLAEIIKNEFGMKYKSSSEAALEIFLLDVMSNEYGIEFDSVQDALDKKEEYRQIWFEEISRYNKEDPARLAKDILKDNDVYVGMRSPIEIDACIMEGLFDLIIGVVDYRKEKESSKSNQVDINQYADVIITNNGSIDNLTRKTYRLLSYPIFMKRYEDESITNYDMSNFVTLKS